MEPSFIGELLGVLVIFAVVAAVWLNDHRRAAQARRDANRAEGRRAYLDGLGRIHERTTGTVRHGR